uniref:Uncharacterized protein n=1 Tax=Avena sativa TaxID=4498 RepID=A0ACD5VQ80_AVESA
MDESSMPALQNHPRVVLAIPDKLFDVHTTHSWEFLGLETSGGNATDGWKEAKFGEGVIIGNVDTGVSPTSESFRDDGLPVPRGWRGKCDAGHDTTFSCNKKLIGARFFNAGIQTESFPEGNPPLNKTDLNSPRDYAEHGSHTLSTAGGDFVAGASAFGRGSGTAKGGSPLARVASYKACYAPGCTGLDVLAAMLTAVADGVHVLSLSLGSPPSDYATDPIAIGAFYAVQKGVTVVCSAGNSGPEPGSVSNLAPWILTVAASTMDRDFPAYVTFGNNTIKGQSLSNGTQPARKQYQMISGDKANAANQISDNSTLCLAGTLDPAKVRNKIVVCTRGVNGRVEKGLVVKQAGGIGMVLCNDASTGNQTVADPHLIPAVHCSYSRCKDLFDYLRSTEFPVGYIAEEGTKLGVKPAPVMADFSSRGPNTITPQILKPDITAPGVDVIAAYSEEVSATGLPFDDRRVPYNILSGTSMSCPHVTGIAGLVKAKYPDWSPAMIKSAIMTTGESTTIRTTPTFSTEPCSPIYLQRSLLCHMTVHRASTGANDDSQIQDETGAAATPFSYGSGHAKPALALDPGLVYDTTLDDYTSFLCSLKPTQPQNLLPLFSILYGADASNTFLCSKKALSFRPENLNYPSISTACLSVSRATTVKRRVKNVGPAYSTYTVSVVQPAAGVRITVQPSTLSFCKTNEDKSFTVKLEVYDAVAAGSYVFGSIEWSDGNHRVWSPVAATTKCE